MKTLQERLAHWHHSLRAAKGFLAGDLPEQSAIGKSIVEDIALEVGAYLEGVEAEQAPVALASVTAHRVLRRPRRKAVAK